MCICVCVRVMFASQEVTHHITQGVWDLALWSYIHFIFSSHAGAVQHLKSFSGKRRVTPRTPAALPLRMESWGAAQARFLWCSTLRLQSPQHQSRGLGIRPRSSPASLRSHTHTHRQRQLHFRFVRLEQSKLPYRDTTKFGKTALCLSVWRYNPASETRNNPHVL